MSAAPGKGADGSIGCDVAVIELLGPEEAARAAAGLAAEAQSAAGVSVRAVLRGDAGESVPLRRRRAADGAAAPVVFLIEDTTAPHPGWAAALSDIFADEAVAAACGPVRVAPDLPPRYRALGRLEYGRFDGAAGTASLPGNAFAIRLADLEKTHDPQEGLIEHELERRLAAAGRKIVYAAALTAVYSKPDAAGARLSTRFGHGRLYGAARGGNPLLGIMKAALAMPVLSLRALQAARRGGPVRHWAPETPWILLMAAAWALGELTGQVVGKGDSERSWT